MISRSYGWQRADYAQDVTEYENGADKESMRRYVHARVKSVTKIRVMSTPALDSATTSLVENVNMHTRQKCCRLSRLTNQHSKSAQNHAHAVALHFFAHNFVRVHSTLTAAEGRETTPTMMHGLAERPWTAEDLVAAMDRSLLQSNDTSARGRQVT